MKRIFMNVPSLFSNVYDICERSIFAAIDMIRKRHNFAIKVLSLLFVDFTSDSNLYSRKCRIPAQLHEISEQKCS